MFEQDNEIRDHPDRTNESRIAMLKEEMEIITSVVYTQRQIVGQMQLRRIDKSGANIGQSQINHHYSAVQESRARQNVPYYTVERRAARGISDGRQRTRVERSSRHHHHHQHEEYYPEYTYEFSQGASLDGFSKLSPTDNGGILGLLLDDCTIWLETRDRGFQEMKLEVARLRTMVSFNGPV
jgi:hypothetical protein